jgi:hypothetical protein
MSRLSTWRPACESAVPVVLGGLKFVALASDVTIQLEKSTQRREERRAHTIPADASERLSCHPARQAHFRAYRPSDACHLASRSAAAKARARRQGRRSTGSASTPRWASSGANSTLIVWMSWRRMSDRWPTRFPVFSRSDARQGGFRILKRPSAPGQKNSAVCTLWVIVSISPAGPLRVFCGRMGRGRHRVERVSSP